MKLAAWGASCMGERLNGTAGGGGGGECWMELQGEELD